MRFWWCENNLRKCSKRDVIYENSHSQFTNWFNGWCYLVCAMLLIFLFHCLTTNLSLSFSGSSEEQFSLFFPHMNKMNDWHHSCRDVDFPGQSKFSPFSFDLIWSIGKRRRRSLFKRRSTKESSMIEKERFQWKIDVHFRASNSIVANLRNSIVEKKKKWDFDEQAKKRIDAFLFLRLD